MLVPVLWVDVDDDHARRIMLSENAANDRATNDTSILAGILRGMDETARLAAGYDDQLAREILALAEKREPLTDPDDAPPRPPRSRTKTKRETVWLLGESRLVCGDATDQRAVRAALGDRAAGMLLADPPYGIDYRGSARDREPIANDDVSAGELGDELLRPAFEIARDVLLPGAAFYVFCASTPLETTFRQSLDLAGLQLRQGLAWVKPNFILGRADFHGQHEVILYGWQLGGEPEIPPHFDEEHEVLLYGWKQGAAHTWEGGRKQSTVWAFDKPKASKLHPTMKPVALLQRAIENNTRPGALVLDPFAGSGSTLIACYASGRRAALVELDPRYCDVICRRYQEHTGTKPILEATGKAVDFSRKP